MSKVSISAIEYRDITTLIQYSRNAKLHPDEQIDQIANSIAEYSFLDPVAVDENNIILEGHGRLAAAKKMGMQQVPVIQIEGLSEAQKKGYRLAHNKLVANSGFDNEALVAELEALATENFDLSLTGFSPSELDELLKMAEDGEGEGDGERDEDEVPDSEDVKKRVKRGQIWEVAGSRIMCGDCRDATDTQKLLGSEPVNVVMTSPPYASQRKYDEESGFMPIPPSEYVQWFEAVQANIKRHLAKDGSFFLNIKEHMDEGKRHIYVLELILILQKNWGWTHIDTFVWTHQGFPISVKTRFKNQWEPIYHLSHTHKIKPIDFKTVGLQVSDSYLKTVKRYQKGYRVPYSNSGFSDAANHETLRKDIEYSRPGNVLSLALGAVGQEYRIQSAAYPVALPEFFIKAFSDIGDRIYDPFCGSGTTLVAAHKNGRIGLGMEISETYCNLILTRMERESGASAKLIASPE